jgi:hypothetical protein
LILLTPIGAVSKVNAAIGVDKFCETAEIEGGSERLQVDGTVPRFLSLS